MIFYQLFFDINDDKYVLNNKAAFLIVYASATKKGTRVNEYPIESVFK
jgi:hypothetical protein